jgi:hypothetical protein
MHVTIRQLNLIRVFSILSIFVLLFTLPSLTDAQEQEKIVETVYVENVEIPVRVFDKTQLVKGLTKANFELYVDGKRTEINAFFEARKKIEENLSPGADPVEREAAAARPRLFALIFNLTDFKQDLAGHLDTLFKTIIKPGDHLIVITNRYFFPEWEVKSPEITKNKIVEILEKEVVKLKSEMLRFENELHSISSELKSRLADRYEKDTDDNYPFKIFRDFFLTYQFVLEDIRNQYLNLPVSQYIKISEYLKGQDMEKWVLNFYQIGRLPLLDKNGPIHRKLDAFIDNDSSDSGGSSSGSGKSFTYTPDMKTVRQKLKSMYFDFIMEIQIIDELYVRDIGKAFLNSGATVHTLLLKPDRQSSITGYGDFKYEDVSTESESIFRQMTKLTGGRVVRSNKISQFISSITRDEDTLYTLTYAPDGRSKKTSQVEVKVDNPTYRVVYDDRKRLKPFHEMVNRLGQLSRSIDIESITCDGRTLTAKLANIELVQFEGNALGAVRARVKIQDKRKKQIVNFEKTYKGIKERGLLQIALPPIADGKYKLILEVKDLFTLKDVYAGDAINFTKGGISR